MDDEFIECSVEAFIGHYLPFEPGEGDVDELIRTAAYIGEPPPSRTNQRPATGVESTCGSVRGALATTFEDLGGVMDAVSKAKVNGRIRNAFQYRACPQAIMSSEKPGLKNKIDGCIISSTLTPSNGSLDFAPTGIAVIFNYKQDPVDAVNCNDQVVSANVQIMNDDARRMFTYGVTVVDTVVTLWYHGRSHSAVSEPFDFVKSPRLLVKIAMSFLFSTEAELGYDPKIVRLPNSRLVFEMADNTGDPIYYRTVRTLSEYRSNNITGKMCRVWEVEQVSEPSETGSVLSFGVLKDVWLDYTSPTERQVQKAIFEAIESRKANIDSNPGIKKFTPTPLSQITELVTTGKYKDYFLTIVTDHKGLKSKKLVVGARWKRGLFWPEESNRAVGSEVTPPHITAAQSTQPDHVGGGETCAFNPRKRKVTVKRQYRIVYAERCLTVDRLDTIGQVFDVLSQTLVALRLLYFAGWVHRDISCGNVMAYRPSPGEKWQAKLCDFEYAREYKTESPANSQNFEIGTPYFMANEIMLNRPMLPVSPTTDIVLQPKSNPEDISHLKALGQAIKARAKAAQGIPGQPAASIVPSFQHDLESIWWLTVYLLTVRVDHQRSQNFAERIFQHTTELTYARSRCLERPVLDKLISCLHPDIAEIAGTLEYLRGRLYHENLERNAIRLANPMADDVDSYAEIHNDFYLAFSYLTELGEEVAQFRLLKGVKSNDVEVVTAQESKKRPRPVSVDDEYVAGPNEDEVQSELSHEGKPKKKKLDEDGS
ncbi:hypothetical protein NMY22_g7598 [Coprinellus aureogranulatus]|nr:hypothetical protein NMY22_g7598 [Coprinellus aureogranulatus]